MYVDKGNRTATVVHVMFVFEFLLYKDFYERHSGVIIEREESDFQVLRCSVIESFAEVRWVAQFTAAAAWATSFPIPQIIISISCSCSIFLSILSVTIAEVVVSYIIWEGEWPAGASVGTATGRFLVWVTISISSSECPYVSSSASWSMS